MYRFFVILFLVSCAIELLALIVDFIQALIAGFYIYKYMIHTKISMLVDRVINTMIKEIRLWQDLLFSFL